LVYFGPLLESSALYNQKRAQNWQKKMGKNTKIRYFEAKIISLVVITVCFLRNNTFEWYLIDEAKLFLPIGAWIFIDQAIFSELKPKFDFQEPKNFSFVVNTFVTENYESYVYFTWKINSDTFLEHNSQVTVTG